MNINKELEYIHAVLDTKHYFFTGTADNGVMLRLEDDIKCKYSFKGMTMVTAIVAAKQYIEQEIKAGSLEDVDMGNSQKEDKEDKDDNTNQQSILNKFKRKK